MKYPEQRKQLGKEQLRIQVLMGDNHTDTAWEGEAGPGGGGTGVTLSTPSQRRGAIIHCQGVSRGQKRRPAGCTSP